MHRPKTIFDLNIFRELSWFFLFQLCNCQVMCAVGKPRSAMVGVNPFV